MISVEQALSIVQNNVEPTQYFESKNILEALGCTLFEDILSPINMPPFRQSAMDGYALVLNGNDTYAIVGEVKAGDSHNPILKKGEAVRIFTGAAVPNTANAVVMQEHTWIDKNILKIGSEVALNENIRPIGEQVLKGQIALKKGTLLTPAAMAFLTSLGITEVKVYERPSIALVVTGNELVPPGKELAYGQIYESNAVMLAASLGALGFKKIVTKKVGDDYDNTLETLREVISNYDVILISGGISVGDYDFVEKALKQLDVEEMFYKVNQKPGKPLFFGKNKNSLVFALPGNPASALSCFYMYVFPALQKRCGNSSFGLTKTHAASTSNYIKKGNRAEFLKAFYEDGTVEVLGGQNSSMLHTFALANALVYVPESLGSIHINDKIEVLLLPIP